LSADLLTHVDDRLSTARMSLDLRLRIHLLVAELLAAPRYASRCAAAARLVGVLDAELLLARDADASDPAEALALGVARKLVLQRGYVPRRNCVPCGSPASERQGCSTSSARCRERRSSPTPRR
jgi:hypothetical protein